MNKPFVSIITTCYNQTHHIRNTLNSVLNQTYSNWECIVVDDGSTDNSKEVIESFQKMDSRFIYVYKTNGGVTSARNYGFKMAKGNFIQFLDGDDSLLPEKLEKQIECFNKNPEIYICICDHQHYYVKQNRYKHYIFTPLKAQPLKQLLYNWQAGVAFTNHAPIYRRDLWHTDEVPFPVDYDGRSEDWIFNVLVALKNKKYYFLNEILCNYHITGESYTSETYNSSSSAIYAAFYLNNIIPEKYKNNFLEHTIKKSMDRYADSKKAAILHDSLNWRVGNFISKPFFFLIRLLRHEK